MPNGENDRGPSTPAAPDPQKSYRALCDAYLRRQVVVYQNWPQRKYGPLGYSAEKVFLDRNA